MRSHFATYGFLVIILSVSFSSCSPSVRLLRPEEIRDSKADEVVLFTTDQRIIQSQPDSVTFTMTDSQDVLHVQGIQQGAANQEPSKPFRGDVAIATVDSIQGRYNPSIYHAGPLFLVLSAAVIAFVVISSRTVAIIH